MEFVSPKYQCTTNQVKYLCIYNIYQKLNEPGEYDIGGVVNDISAEEESTRIWFYFSVHKSVGKTILINLFVCLRTKSYVVVNVGKSTNIMKSQNYDSSKYSLLTADNPDEFTSYSFNSSEEDENFHIQTYPLSYEDRDSLIDGILLIPVRIDTKEQLVISADVKDQIKSTHNFSKVFNGNKDFSLISSSGNKHYTSKMVLASQVEWIRDHLETNSSELAINLDDHETDLLLNFLYNGTIEDIQYQDYLRLFSIDAKLKVKNLNKFLEKSLRSQISVETALDILLVTEKYKMFELQYEVLMYFKKHKSSFNTGGWSKLDNVEVSKKIIQVLISP